MITAGVFPIEIPRHQPFHMEIGFPGVDLSGAAFSFEVRPNAEGNDVRLSRASGGNGITAALTQVSGANYTIVSIDADKATIEALPLSQPVGSDEECVYGFKVNGVEYLRGAAKIGARANHV